ncbi:hypothetical protein ACF0MN_10990 [Legionella pneumophila]|uniref:hypothetical protein n=1 Tax=Legionella pneumophila TaxID=446 RepID=UPI0036F4AB80
MNDFTKEELNIIADALALLIGRCSIMNNLKDVVLHLSERIESMIDNYCEHQWRLSGINAIYCPKCQKHVEYDDY